MATAKYVLNIDPKLSQEDAKNTEQQLNSRFSKVAKNYGEEMKRQNSKVTDHFDTSMKGIFSKLKGGWIALAGVVASVLTSPFNEVDDKVNELLNQVDNTQTRAEQWGVDPARYLAFQKTADINGVQADQADNLLMRIADRLDKARTGEDPTLKKYLGEKDILDVAHALFMTWKQMSPLERAGSMSDILGTRQANQFAELVQADWNATANRIQGGRKTGAINKRMGEISSAEQIQKENRAKAYYDLLMNSGNISAIVADQSRVELQKQTNLLSNMARYNELASTEITQLKIQAGIDKAKDGIYQLVDMIADRFGINGKTEQVKAFQKDIKTLTTPSKAIRETQEKLPQFFKDNMIKRPTFKIPGVK